MDLQPAEEETQTKPPIPLSTMLVSFLRLGATSFGGGTTAWTYRETVERRGWLSEESFLQALTVAQVLPGANAVNLAVFLGMQLRGVAGASVAAFGMVFPAFILILVLAGLYQQLKGYPEAQAVLTGLACVGISATLINGVKASKLLRGRIVPILIATAIFVLVGLLRWPLVWTVLVLTPASIVSSYILDRKQKNG
jgi:chromate transporter